MGYRWENGTIVAFEDEPNPIQEEEEARAKAYRERGAPSPLRVQTHPEAAGYWNHLLSAYEPFLLPDGACSMRLNRRSPMTSGE